MSLARGVAVGELRLAVPAFGRWLRTRPARTLRIPLDAPAPVVRGAPRAVTAVLIRITKLDATRRTGLERSAALRGSWWIGESWPTAGGAGVHLHGSLSVAESHAPRNARRGSATGAPVRCEYGHAAANSRRTQARIVCAVRIERSSPPACRLIRSSAADPLSRTGKGRSGFPSRSSLA